ncbi:MAG TPA: MATE family efflux transporter [Acidimicrobiales bacterium]|nr:MATE family efflux transporter [Acidimicrobiales bacterium]
MGVRLDATDKRILALAIPALGSLAIEPVYVLADTAIVGRLGTAPLGGLAIASTVLNTLMWVSNVLSYGTTAQVAFLVGRGDRKGAEQVGAQGLWLCGLLGIPAAVLVALLARPLAELLGGRGDVLHAAVTYLRISAVGVPAVLVTLLGHGWFRGLSDTRTPLRIVLVANVLNIVLEVVFVYGFRWGVAGSAWGTVVAQFVAAAWFLVLGVGGFARPVAQQLRRLLVIGRHLFFRTLALVAVLVLATSVAARVSTPTLAGHQIALQLFTFLALLVDALAIAAQALVGTSLGAGQAAGARETGMRLVRLGLLVGAGIGVVVIATSPVVPRIFTADGEVVHQATIALVLLGAMQVSGAVAFVLDGVLMGASDFRALQWITVAAGIAFLPFAAAVLHWHRLGIAGIWVGLFVWMTVRALAIRARFNGEDWTALAASPPA